MSQLSKPHGRCAAALLALALAVSAPESHAETPTAESVGAALEQVDAEIAARHAQAGSGASDEVAQLERWRAVLSEHLSALQQREEIEGALNAPPSLELDARLATGPPYSLSQLDSALRQRQGWQSELLELDAAAESAADSLEAARRAFEKAEAERRRAKELSAPALPERVRAARIAEARLALRQLQAGNASRSAALIRQRLSATEALPERLFRGLALTDADELEVMDRLDRAETDLRRRLERATLDLEEAESRWTAFQRRLSEGGSVREETGLHRARLGYRQKAVALLNEQIERVRTQRDVELARLEVLATASPDRKALLERLDASRAVAEELQRASRLDRAEIATLEQDVAVLGARSVPGEGAAGADHIEILRARIGLEQSNLESVLAAIAAEDRLQHAIGLRVGGRTFKDQLEAVFKALRGTWRYELFSSEDRPVTVGKVLTALVLIVVGLWLARVARRALESRLLPRLGLDDGASHAFAVLAFYGLLVAIVLFSLQTVSIPLTAFAVLGGALAIGLGFGSQNVVNNFISGVILLAERPIKVGDLVDVDGTYGNIERIGARSTRIRTGDNIHVIVPNSTFLESNVVNWTHTDARCRISVSVGVSYGSPTREVRRCLLQALSEDERIRSSPEPIVLFRDFGNDALQFSAHFWVQVRHMMDRLTIESDLRFRLDDLFREAGIVVAFPQRDVHLDTAEPLALRVTLDPGERALEH